MRQKAITREWTFDAFYCPSIYLRRIECCPFISESDTEKYLICSLSSQETSRSSRVANGIENSNKTIVFNF